MVFLSRINRIYYCHFSAHNYIYIYSVAKNKRDRWKWWRQNKKTSLFSLFCAVILRKREVLSTDGKKNTISWLTMVDDNEEKRATRGNIRAINRSHNCERISVSRLVLWFSDALPVSRSRKLMKWRPTLAFWGYCGCCWLSRPFLMVHRQLKRNAKHRSISGIPRI